MGERSSEDAVEEAVPQHGIVPQTDPDCPIEGPTTETLVSKRCYSGSRKEGIRARSTY
jgi:hypothetical protein